MTSVDISERSLVAEPLGLKIRQSKREAYVYGRTSGGLWGQVDVMGNGLLKSSHASSRNDAQVFGLERVGVMYRMLSGCGHEEA